MSALEKIDRLASHMEEMHNDMLTIQDLMEKSESGRYLRDASILWMESEPMQELQLAHEDESIPEENRSLLAEYMAEMIQRDQVNGVKLYANYLDTLAQDPKYFNLKSYHEMLRDKALAMYNSTEYQDYLVLYADFIQDKTPEAVEARVSMESLQGKIHSWTEK